MATWQTPVTNRTDGARMTASDMNRIVGNILVVYPKASFTVTTYTNNDYVAVTAFNEIYTNLHIAAQALGVNAQGISTEQTYNNMNHIENVTALCKAKIDLIAAQNIANIYSGDDLYAGDNNYVRGH